LVNERREDGIGATRFTLPLCSITNHHSQIINRNR
jgi:hypothetical protein